MDSLHSVPESKKQRRFLSATFALIAGVSGSVNAATTPNFTEEPAGSQKLFNVKTHQQSILDMLAIDHPSRPGIKASIESLEDGGSVEELTRLYNWALTISNSPSAPPAAKKEAEAILQELTNVPSDNVDDSKQAETPIAGTAVPPPPLKPLIPEKKPTIKKDKDEIVSLGETDLATEGWKINEGSTCVRTNIKATGELDIGDQGYLQLTQTLSPREFPRHFLGFCESRMGVIVKIIFYDKSKKTEVAISADGKWTDELSAPPRFDKVMLSVFINGKQNDGKTIPKVRIRKPGK